MSAKVENRKMRQHQSLSHNVSFTFLLAFRLPVTPIMFLSETRECKRVPKVWLVLGLAGKSNIGIFINAFESCRVQVRFVIRYLVIAYIDLYTIQNVIMILFAKLCVFVV